jgi:hypothetical protein
VNGIVTNLLLREGDYARQGATNVSIIDTDSYWVDGYFEETKLARLCVGDRAEAKLIGYSARIMGHIATVARGVSVSNAAASTQGLPNVDPVYLSFSSARIALSRQPLHLLPGRCWWQRFSFCRWRWVLRARRRQLGQEAQRRSHMLARSRPLSPTGRWWR